MLKNTWIGDVRSNHYSKAWEKNPSKSSRSPKAGIHGHGGEDTDKAL